MNNIENDVNWLILDDNTISELDYLIGSIADVKIPENLNKTRFFYNQANMRDKNNIYLNTRWSCGLFGSMGAISDLTWYEFTKDDILEIQKLAIDKFGLSVPWGMYMSKAVDCLRTWWNAKFPDNKLITFRTTIWTDVFLEALEKNHSPVIWYRTSVEYSKDSQDNWIVDWEDFPNDWGGHLVRTNFNSEIKIDDNYVWWKPYNTYTNNKLVKLKEKWVFFPSAYLFLYDTSMTDQIKNDIDLDNAKKFFARGFTNWLNPRKPLSRQEFWATMEVMLKDMWK